MPDRHVTPVRRPAAGPPSCATLGTAPLGITALGIAVLCAAPRAAHAQTPADGGRHRWERLAPLPERLGVAGACAGVSNGALVVAGGAHFPVPLAAGGPKVWTGAVHVATLGPDDGLRWRAADPLGAPLGYAASVPAGDAVLCVGGGDAARHVADVLTVRWRGERVVVERTLPPLPHPVAFAAAARVGRTVYVAGGLRAPGDSTALRSVWALDLSAPDARWRALPPLPGPGRYDAVGGAMGGAFYLFSGVALAPDGRGGVTRRFLRDAYRYRPGRGWQRLAGLPWAAAAAPSPAVAAGPSRLLVLGGNDGALADSARALGDRHPGFRREVLAYDATTNAWVVADTLPAAHVNTPTVPWGTRVLVPSGELRPGVRTPVVLRFDPGPAR